MNFVKKGLFFLPLLCVSLFCAGCGGGGIVVHGKLVKDGKPLQVSEKGLILLSLTNEEAKKSYSADVDKEGNFVLKDLQSGGGIPPGKYRFSIQQFDPYTGGESDTDKLKGAFSGPKSPVVRTIESGQENITIDLAKPQGS